MEISSVSLGGLILLPLLACLTTAVTALPPARTLNKSRSSAMRADRSIQEGQAALYGGTLTAHKGQVGVKKVLFLMAPIEGGGVGIKRLCVADAAGEFDSVSRAHEPRKGKREKSSTST
jgi:hypothetical protein